MKKLLLLLFLIPNLVMAETWVCSYLLDGRIENSRYERKGDNFFWYINDELTVKLDIWYESDYQIKLIESDRDGIGFGTKLLTRNPPKVVAVHTYATESTSWKGNCEIVE